MPAGSNSSRQVKLLMVCLGNICRSPTAHGVMEKLIKDKGLEGSIQVDSSGTSTYHIGERPDSRSVAAAAKRGYDLTTFRARQVSPADFQEFDYILAMDRQNLRELRKDCPGAAHGKLSLLLDYIDNEHDAVPDPYYSGPHGFELVLDLVEAACNELLEQVCQEHFTAHGAS